MHVTTVIALITRDALRSKLLIVFWNDVVLYDRIKNIMYE